MPAPPTTIAIVDDDPQMQRLIGRNLQMEGYATVVAANGREGVALVTTYHPALVLMDIMMPKMDGFTACQRIRAFSAVPIIILTARGGDEDKVHGLDMGADDYLTKPFSVDELLARVRAVLRRAEQSSMRSLLPKSATVIVGDITIDSDQHLVMRAGQELPLTPTEYQLCAYLAHNAGRVLTHQLLLEQVWGTDYLQEQHILQVNINRLRQKIEPEPATPRYIVTKAGVGYMMPKVLAPPSPEQP